MVKEMEKLRALLDAESVEWEDVSNAGEYCPISRTHFMYRGHKWSVIHGYGTYGGLDPITGVDSELLEAWNFKDEPIGFLTAEEVMEYVRGTSYEGHDI